jgi:hypothetical protein
MQTIYACPRKQSTKIMKKDKKSVLTSSQQKTSLRSMPIQKPIASAQNGSKKAKTPPLERRYSHFFVAVPSPLWQHDGDNFSLEQPSPYKWVPSKTTYGIDVTLCPMPNA